MQSRVGRRAPRVYIRSRTRARPSGARGRPPPCSMHGAVPLWVYWLVCLLAVAMGVFALMACYECCCLLPSLRRRQKLVYGVRPAQENIVPGKVVPFLTQEIVILGP